jgi:hypothetical protein
VDAQSSPSRDGVGLARARRSGKVAEAKKQTATISGNGPAWGTRFFIGGGPTCDTKRPQGWEKKHSLKLSNREISPAPREGPGEDRLMQRPPQFAKEWPRPLCE